MTDTPQDVYPSPFSQRYAGKQRQALLSPWHRARLFRRLWLMLARSQRALGLPITEAQLHEMAARTEDVDLAGVERLERQTRHDVMAHLQAFAAVCPGAAPILHQFEDAEVGL